MSVRFLMHLPPMPAEPEDGYVHKPVEYVEISGQGTGNDVICRAATEADKERHREAYAEFKATLAPKPPKPHAKEKP